ncbi:MAG: zinc-dependent metalloprotease, partial [Chloroflexi bacterium]|nr:zinc-dependent metalloprotease [Chloroflexota bacterium]
HAFQFNAGNPPWLHGYMCGLQQDYLEEAVVTLGEHGELRARLSAAVQEFQRGGLRQSGWLRLALSPRQVRTIEQIQALMTVVEGYGNHVMHATGARLIPGYAHLARRMKARERSQATWVRLLTRALGLDMKLEQYRIGEAFVDEVVTQRGIAFANRLWEGPEHLPTLAETQDPAAWMARVEAASPADASL